MITKKEYLEAKKLIAEYKLEKLSNAITINHVVIGDCPEDYWYSTQKGKKFNIKSCSYSDFIDVAGFSNREPNTCWKVVDGEFSGCVIAKEHCFNN